MNEKQYLESLLESDQLQIINGTAYFNDEPLHDPTPAESMVPNEYGFFGSFDEFYCRQNVWVNEAIEDAADSDDPHMREAAEVIGNLRIMFFDTREQLDNAPDEIRAIYRMNSQNRLNRGAFLPLIDADGVPIEGRFWPMIGNYAVPGATTRRGLESNLKMKIDFMLRNQRDLIAGGGGTLADRSGR